MLLLVGWSCSGVGAEGGGSTVVGDCGRVLVAVPVEQAALVPEQVEQALPEVDGDLLQLGEGGEERGGEGLGLGEGLGEGWRGQE